MFLHSPFKHSFPAGLALLCLLLASCSTVDVPPPVTTTTPEEVPGTPAHVEMVEALLAEAETLPPGEAASRYTEAARLLLDNREAEQAVALLERIRDNSLPTAQRTGVLLLRAEALVASGREAEALPLLNGDELSSLPSFPPDTQILLRNLRAQSFYAAGQYLLSAQERIYMDSQLNGVDQLDNHELIWQTLMQIDVSQLRRLSQTSVAFEFQGWYELALIGKSSQINLDRQQVELERWLQGWQRHPAARALPSALQTITRISDSRPSRIGLLLPLQSTAGKVVRDGFMSAWYNAKAIGVTVPEVTFYDTTNAGDIVALHARARAEGAELIVGPLLKPQVDQLLNVGFLGVPTLALNTLDDTPNPPRQLYQFALSPETEIAQIIDHAWEQGFRHAAVLSPYEPNSNYYTRKRESFREHWIDKGGLVVSEGLFSGDFTDVIENMLNLSNSEQRHDSLSNLLNTRLEFVPRRRQDIDFILLMADPVDARQIKPSLAYLFAGDIPVIATQDVYEGRRQPQLDRDLDGITFSDSPWLLESQDESREETRRLFPQNNATLLRLQAFGIDAFRLHPRLAQLESDNDILLFGATGQLHMDENRVIRQEFNWSRFRDGVVVSE